MKTKDGKNSFSIKGERHSWITMFMLAKWTQKFLEPIVQDQYIFFGGSLIRNQPDCGDLDLCLAPRVDKLLAIEKFHEMAGDKGQILVSGMVNRITMPFEDKLIQVDMWLTEPEHWGAMCMFVAGSGKFNMIQRIHAAKQGYLLSQNGLFQKEEERIEIPCYTETKVYEELKWAWVPYEKRSLG